MIYNGKGSITLGYRKLHFLFLPVLIFIKSYSSTFEDETQAATFCTPIFNPIPLPFFSIGGREKKVILKQFYMSIDFSKWYVVLEIVTILLWLYINLLTYNIAKTFIKLVKNCNLYHTLFILKRAIVLKVNIMWIIILM